jgi:hypothetical protein
MPQSSPAAGGSVKAARPPGPPAKSATPIRVVKLFAGGLVFDPSNLAPTLSIGLLVYNGYQVSVTANFDVAAGLPAGKRRVPYRATLTNKTLIGERP